MIRLGATTQDGRTLVLLGFSHENIARLRYDKPVKVDLEDWHVPMVTVIVFAGRPGQTEEEMATEFQELIGADTDVRVDSRLFKGSD